MIDTDLLQQQYPMTEIIQRLAPGIAIEGIHTKNPRSGCPVCGEPDMDFSITHDDTYGQCWQAGCGFKGNIFHLVQKVNGITFLEAVEWITGEKPNERKFEPREKDKQQSERNEWQLWREVNDAYTKHIGDSVRYWGSRGINTPTVEKFTLGAKFHTYKGQTNYEYVTLEGQRIPRYPFLRYTIPWKWDVHVLGYKMRLDYEEARKVLEEIPFEHIAAVIEDLRARGKNDDIDHVIDAFSGGRYLSRGKIGGIFNGDILVGRDEYGGFQYKHHPFVITCEGEADMLTLDQLGIPAVGMKTHDKIPTLFQNVENIVIFQDNDDPGSGYRDSIIEKSQRRISDGILVIRPVDGYKDINDMHRAGVLIPFLEAKLRIFNLPFNIDKAVELAAL